MASDNSFGFNFRPLGVPYVQAPIEGLSNLNKALEERYMMGEAISDQAKDLFGTMEVAPKDLPLLNAVADEVDNELRNLVDKYEGAYESNRFQRDAKDFLRRMSRDPRIRGMKKTLEEYKKEEDLLWKAASDPRLSLLNFGQSQEPRTVIDENGNVKPYTSSYEAAQDWLADAREYLGKFIPKKGSTAPNIYGLELKDLGNTLDLLRTGQYEKVVQDDIANRVLDMADSFINSPTGGNQLARKIARDIGVDVYNEDGSINKDVRSGIVDFLFRVGNQNIYNNTQYNYRFMPSQFYKTDGNDPSKSPRYNPIYDFGPINNPDAPIKFDSKTSKNAFVNTIDEKIALIEEKARDELKTERTLGAKTLGYFSGGYGDSGQQLATGEYGEQISALSKLKNINNVTPSTIVNVFRKEYGEDANTYINRFFPELNNVMDIASNIVENKYSTKDDSFKRKEADKIATNLYNDALGSLEVLKQQAYHIDQNTREFFDDALIGKGSGIGLIKTFNFIDKDNNPLTFEQLMKKYNKSISNPEDVKSFKESLNITAKIIPKITPATMAINVGGDTYYAISSDRNEKINAEAISNLFSPLLIGQANTSESVLPFLNNIRATAYKNYNVYEDENGNPRINTVVYVNVPMEDGTTMKFPMDEIIKQYLKTTSYFNPYFSNKVQNDLIENTQ